jgi:quinol monooxygenase YgiN
MSQNGGRGVLSRTMKDLHEFISFRFRPEFDRDEQFKTMEELQPLMGQQPGFLRRDWFYSERDGSWVSHIVWTDEAALDAATAIIEANPNSMALLARFDPASMRYAKFEQVGSAVPCLV